MFFQRLYLGILPYVFGSSHSSCFFHHTDGPATVSRSYEEAFVSLLVLRRRKGRVHCVNTNTTKR